MPNVFLGYRIFSDINMPVREVDYFQCSGSVTFCYRSGPSNLYTRVWIWICILILILRIQIQLRFRILLFSSVAFKILIKKGFIL
jgi:hypothetical protein